MSKLPIDVNAEPAYHISPYKRIDMRYPGRRTIIRREEVLDNLVHEPDPEVYVQTWNGDYVLKNP